MSNRTRTRTTPTYSNDVADRRTGTVKWFSAEKGYGFIRPDDGSPDVFVHWKLIDESVADRNGRRNLTENERVEYELGEGAKGTQAEQVRPIGAAD